MYKLWVMLSLFGKKLITSTDMNSAPVRFSSHVNNLSECVRLTVHQFVKNSGTVSPAPPESAPKSLLLFCTVLKQHLQPHSTTWKVSWPYRGCIVAASWPLPFFQFPKSWNFIWKGRVSSIFYNLLVVSNFVLAEAHNFSHWAASTPWFQQTRNH